MFCGDVNPSIFTLNEEELSIVFFEESRVFERNDEAGTMHELIEGYQDQKKGSSYHTHQPDTHFKKQIGLTP
jgi:hypothetical protein